MQRVILFRFHAYPVICKNRLILLKKINPHIQIFGLFGGEEKYYPKFQKELKPYCKNIYCIRKKTDRWKRLNADLAVRLWYKDTGSDIDFDILHLIEWDLVLFDPLDKIYRDIPQNSVGLTALTLLEKVEKEWWVSKEPYRSQWRQLLDFARDKFNYQQQPYACQGPGPCLPKSFLEKYSTIEVPEFGNDELRLPLFSQIFGFKLCDTGLQKKWFDKEEKKLFNCDKAYINLSTISQQLALPEGRRAFHPFTKMITFNHLDYLINLLVSTSELAKNLGRKIIYR